MMVSGLPVMAADFTSDIAVETYAQTDEFDANQKTIYEPHMSCQAREL